MKRLWIVVLTFVIAVGGSLATPRGGRPALSARAALAPSGLAGAPPGLSMEVEPAFDGHFKYGEWLPVWVELENSGPDLEAEVQVPITGSWGTIVFAAPAPLPTGSRKRIPVYVLPNNFSHALEVHLVAGGDGVPAAHRERLLSRQVPAQPQLNIVYLVGLLAPQRGALSFINNVSLRPEGGQERTKVLVDLSIEDLPERSEALRSFDCLILNDTDTSSLTPQQKTALEAWVRQGGRLIVGGGAGAMRTAAGLPESLLPFGSTPGGQVEVDALPGLADYAGAQPIRIPGPFVIATGSDPSAPPEPAEGPEPLARTLAFQAGLPLIHEHILGAGFVDFVALDLAGSPFNAWEGTTAFWEKLLSPGAAYPDWLPPDVSARQMRSGQMTYALSNLPALDLPSLRGLGILLILYILLIGPLNYLVLRWLKRLHWAWITVPLITLAFSAGAFGIGYALRGSDLILNKIAVIQLRPDGTAQITSYLGLFSPARQSYQVQVLGDGLLSPLTPDYNPWGPGVQTSAGSEMVFVQGEGQPATVRGLTVNQWSMQTFMFESSEFRVPTQSVELTQRSASELQTQNSSGIEADLRFQDHGLVGTIRNQTPYHLSDTVLILGSRFKRLGDLQPGQATPVAMDLDDPANGSATGGSFDQPFSYRLFQDQLMATGGPTDGGAQRQTELKRIVVESVFEQGGWGPQGGTINSLGGTTQLAEGRLVLLGWLDAAPPEVHVAGRPPAQQTTAMLYTPLTYRFPETGDIALPPGLVPGVMSAMPREGGRCGNQVTAVWLGRGEAIFDFQIPDEIRDVRVDALKLLIGSMGGGGWQAPDTALYAWDSETWTALDGPTIGINSISDPGGLVSDSGQVRVRLSEETDMGTCLYVELGLEGTR